MRYLSVCSGIEAATVAWESLGWSPVAFAEIEKFPSAVLAYHYPAVPNLGDMTRINGTDFRGKIDVLVGGTPCQSFSVAGLRRGLDDDRGNLALEFVRIANESDPAFIIWENVIGVLSDEGNAFGNFLSAIVGAEFATEPGPRPPLGKSSEFWRWSRKRVRHVPAWPAAGWADGPKRAAAWRVLDAQYFGLAQRRRRVFLVASSGDGADPRQILFESEGLRRDTPPSREARALIAGTLEASLERSRGAGTPPGAIITQALTGRLGGGGPDDNKAQGGFYVASVAPTVNAGGNRTGGNRPFGTAVDTCESLVAFGGGNCQGEIQTATTVTSHGRRQDFDTETFVAYPLRAQDQSAHDDSLETYIPIAFHGSQDPHISGGVTHPCGRNNGQETCVVDARSSVRRLTPRECERLQGFPDAYTAIPYRRPFGNLPKFILERSYQRYLRRMTRQGKEPLQLADLMQCADGPRYKALGNSMAVPVMRWIGERITKYQEVSNDKSQRTSQQVIPPCLENDGSVRQRTDYQERA